MRISIRCFIKGEDKCLLKKVLKRNPDSICNFLSMLSTTKKNRIPAITEAPAMDVSGFIFVKDNIAIKAIPIIVI